METNQNQKDLEACLRTFKRLCFKIDEMNSKLSHIIEDLREVYLKKSFGEPDPYQKFWEDYQKNDQPDENEEESTNDYQ